MGPIFKRELKALSKRYRSIKEDVGNLVEELRRDPCRGVVMGQFEGHDVRKVRMKINSKHEGKSGGARVITLDTIIEDDSLKLVFIHDKSDRESIKMSEIKKMLKYQ